MDTYAWEAVIDLHSHILPGVDDGVRTLDEAVALARAAAAEGVTTIAATPHVRHDYPTAVERMEAGVAEVRAALAAAGVPVEVVPGGELDLEFSATFSDDELRRFSLGGSGRFILLEFPDAGWPLALNGRLAALRALGLAALLAHPERNAEVRARPGVLAAAVEHGALVQVTAGSLEGRMGRTAQAAATPARARPRPRPRHRRAPSGAARVRLRRRSRGPPQPGSRPPPDRGRARCDPPWRSAGARAGPGAEPREVRSRPLEG